MHAYSVDGSAASGSNLTIMELIAATTRRGYLYYIGIGSHTTAPADAALDLNIIRGTVAGTATSTPTPRALDPANPAAILTAGVGTFTGQTKTSNSSLLVIPLNQRATFQWYAVPGREIVVPATSSNWVGLESVAVSSGTPTMDTVFHYFE